MHFLPFEFAPNAVSTQDSLLLRILMAFSDVSNQVCVLWCRLCVVLRCVCVYICVYRRIREIQRSWTQECPISNEFQDNRWKQHKENIYDGHWHSSPQFCIQAFLITRYHSGGVKVQKSLKGEWFGVGWLSWLDWKQTHLCIFTRQNDYKVRFAAEVLQWHLIGEFMLELGSVSESKNHCHPVCLFA